MGEINMRRLLSPQPMAGKTFYTVKSGDYLQKIARQFNTTIALIKKMNNMQTDTIRVGARLIVFEGSFSILVSKNNNLLDLMLNEQLFKRYPVGTGKFGKTPAVDFFIYDKIIEPPWTDPPIIDSLNMVIQKTCLVPVGWLYDLLKIHPQRVWHSWNMGAR